nr:Talin-1 [Polyrhizophydium stewartii]
MATTWFSARRCRQYMSDMYVQDVVQDIRERYNYGEAGLDYGLLFREQSLWLAPNKLLDHYDLKFGDTLEFRKRHRVLKVKTLDNSIKAILIDESQPVRVVVAAVCERIGISNHDEYSFTSERAESPSKKSDKKAKSKESLYSDEKSWLNPEKTLREHGLTESDIVILKKKFFFTDQNVDRTDPVQLMLMYNQSREMIVSGKHPCTAVEAAQLGAIQMQIQFGNHEPDKHKPGFVKLKDFVPPEYQKNKDVEKKMFGEHSKLQGMTELNAKFRYVQMCRSLKTYGTTFFVVKEPATKKKKAANVLLGVTKQNVVRMDIETKEVLGEWKLTQIRRWAATAKNFTLDFGDYSENYYNVETTEGEQISRLIAGYIDIIVKKRNQKSKTIEEARVEEQAVMEDYVRPGRANNVEVVSSSGVARQAKESHSGAAVMFIDDSHSSNDRLKVSRHPAGGAPQGEVALNLDMLEFQQAIIQTINNGLAVTAAAHADLSVPTHLAAMSNDPATLKWRQETCDITGEAVASNIAACLASVGTLIIHATGNTDDMDYDTIGSRLFTIISSVGQITQGIKMLSGLQQSEASQEEFLAAAKALNEATARMLRDLQPIITGNLIMDDFYAATRVMASASAGVLKAIDHLEVSDQLQRDLYGAAEAVANAVALAVDHTKNMANAIREQDTQQMCLSDSGLATEIGAMLGAVTASLAPTVHVPVCREQLAEAAVLMRDGAFALLSYSEHAGGSKFVPLLQDAVRDVEQAIASLLELARNGEISKNDEIEEYYDQIVIALDNLANSIGAPEQVVANAKQVTISATRLAEVLKAKAAETTDESERMRLTQDAQEIAALTGELVSAAKGLVMNSQSPEAQEGLLAVIDELRDAVDRACGPYIKASMTQRLIHALKSSTASSNQLMSCSRNCAASNRDQSSQLLLNRAIKRVVETIPKAVQAIKGSAAKPNDHVASVRLIQSAKGFLVPATAMVESARTAALTTVDSGAQTQLLASTQQLADELQHLADILNIYEQIVLAEEIAGAQASLQATQLDIRQARTTPRMVAVASTFDPAVAELQVAQNGKSIQSALGQLATAFKAGDERAVGHAITEAITNLQSLTTSSIGIALTTQDPSLSDNLLQATGEMSDVIGQLVQAARDKLADPTVSTDFDELQEMAGVAIAKAFDCLPGQRALVMALGRIRAVTDDAVTSGYVSVANEANKTAIADAAQASEGMQARLLDAAIELRAATNALVVASKADPTGLQSGAGKIETAFESLVEASLVLAKIQTDDAAGGQDVTAIVQTVGSEFDQFLSSLKGSALDPENAGLKGMLLDAAKSVGNTIDELLGKLAVTAPGFDQCSQAMQTIGEASAQLSQIESVVPVQGSYSETVEAITAGEAAIEDAVAVMTAHIAAHDGQKLADTLVKLAETVNKMTAETVRAAQLIAQSDPLSQPAVAPIVDQKQLHTVSRDLKNVCRKIVDKDSAQKEILESAAAIAKDTTAICNLCKAASQEPKIAPAARQEFARFSKDTSAKTAQLVGAIKQLAVKRTDDARAQCADTTQKLISTVDELVALASAPEYAGEPARVSPQAAEMQQPLMENAQRVLADLRRITMMSQAFCGSPDNTDLQNQLLRETESMSKAVGNMVKGVKDSGPGQRECGEAVERLQVAGTSLEAAIAQAVEGKLAPSAATTLAVAAGVVGIPQKAEKPLIQDNLQAIANLAEVISRSSRGDIVQLGNAVEELPLAFAKVSSMAIGYAAGSDSKLQLELLESTRALSGALSSYVSAIKSDCADPNDFGAIQIEAEKTALKAAIASVVSAIEGPNEPGSVEFANANEKVETLLLNMVKAMPAATAAPSAAAAASVTPATSISGTTSTVAVGGASKVVIAKDSGPYTKALPPLKPLQVSSAEIEQKSKKLVDAVSGVLSKQAKAEDYAPAAVKLSDMYEELMASTASALQSTDDDELRKRLIDLARDVGGSTLKVIDALRPGAAKPTPDASVRLKISQAVRDMSNKLSDLSTAAKESCKGVMACQKGVAQLDDAIAELETSSIFAQAKQLDPVDSSDHFADHKDPTLLAAKALSEAVNAFVHANTATQEELAAMVVATVTAASALNEHVQKAATAVTSSDSAHQLQLLTSGKAVAASVQTLIKAAGNASGMGDASRFVVELSEAVRQQYDAINGLVGLVCEIGDDSQRVARALDSAIEGIAEAGVIAGDSSAPALGTALPGEVVATAKQLAATAASVVASASASGKQDSLVTSAGDLRKVVEDLARAGKAATELAPDDKKREMINAIVGLTASCQALLASAKTVQASHTPESKQQLQASTKAVTASVTEVVSAAGKLVPDGYVDPNDPNVVAERELLTAASAIEAAAKRLAAFKPAERPREANTELNFDEQIYEAAKAIAAATSALVRSATGAQREIIARGRTAPKEEAMYFSDGTWSDGLVSAAKQVAAATGELCEAANEAVKGNVQRERVIVCAKNVSASTVQLLTAAAVRSDSTSQAQIRLRAAGKAVTDATEQLVDAARAAGAPVEEEVESLRIETTSATRAKVLEMEAQMTILRMEKELERARAGLAAVRKGRYATAGPASAVPSPVSADGGALGGSAQE